MRLDFAAFWDAIVEITAKLANEGGWAWIDGLGWLPIVGDGPNDLPRETVRWIESNRAR